MTTSSTPSHSDAERQQLAEQVRVANERFLLATELVNAIIYEWDNDSKTVFYSGAIERILGDRPDNNPVTQEWWMERVHPEDRKIIYAAYTSMTPGETTRGVIEYRIRHRDGHYLNVADRAVVRWNGDQIDRVLGNAEDVTERRRQEEALREAKEAAEAASLAKSSFLASMSHEIRTPLGSILGFTELLMAPGLDAAERMSHLLTIRRNGKQLARLIDDILDLSKVEAGKLDIERVEVGLAELIGDIETTLRPTAETKGIVFDIDLRSPIPRCVRSDPTRLRQILVNLLGNAVKFTSRGRVNMAVHWQATDKAPLGTLTFDVVDTGVGMSEAQIDRLFQPFIQGDSTTTRKFGGTGLGLVLARRLARALGGDVQLVRSLPGRGTHFCITVAAEAIGPAMVERLPGRNDPYGMGPGVERSYGRLSGVRVLLVDDAPDNRLLIQRFLTLEGASVDVADNGRTGIEHASRDDFDIVLMDIQMPEMDGYEATQYLRAHGYRPPIVALTAHAMKEEAERCLKAGFTAHLTKPVDRMALYDNIQRLVGRGTSMASRPSGTPLH
jgi:PAS domain S-box-containing protein